jgi:carbon storage regulator
MLILSRKIGQEILIAKDVVVVVKRIKGDRVSIGIEASPNNKILRGELALVPRLALSMRAKANANNNE